MAAFPWSKGSSDEKHPSSAEETNAVQEEGVVDEASDDLHREMKPRQLSKPSQSPPSRLWSVCGEGTGLTDRRYDGHRWRNRNGSHHRHR